MEKAAELMGGQLLKDANGNYIRDENGKIKETYDDSLTDDERREIQKRINMTDWSSVEDLKILQYELIETYELEEDKAAALVKTIMDVNYATSKVVTAVDVFGDLFK
jgi:hypothetical protein